MKKNDVQKSRYRKIAFQIDIARQMESPSNLRKIINYGASLGYNELFLYGEASLEYKSHPECSVPWALKQDEFSKLVEYARKRNMDLIPVIPVLGHANYVLKNASLAHLREVKKAEQALVKCDMEQFCTSNPESYRVIEDLLSEWALITKAECIHIGGDESWNFATCPECRKAAERDGRGKMIADHFNKVNGIVKRYGKRTMIWHDMLFYYDGAIERLDKDIIICDWHYKPLERHPGISIYNWVKTDFIGAYEKYGLEYYICPKSKFNYPYESNNIRNSIEYTETRRPTGFLNTVWEMSHMPYASCYPSLAYGAASCSGEELPLTGDFLLKFAGSNFKSGAGLMPFLCELFSRVAERRVVSEMAEIINYQDTTPEEYLSSQLDNALKLLPELKPSTLAGKMYKEAMELIFLRNFITTGINWRINEISRIFLPGRRVDKKNIEKLIAQLEKLKGKIPGQLKKEEAIWNKYRPKQQKNPCIVGFNLLQENVSSFLKEIRRIVSGRKKAEKVFPLLLELSIVNNDCSWQYLSIFSSTDGKKYHKAGDYPQCGPFGRYVRTFLLPDKAKYVKLELSGFGQLLLHYIRVVSPGFNAVPGKIKGISGNVSDSENLLLDDFRPAVIGSLDSKKYFSEGKEQPQSIIEIKLNVI